MDEKKRLLVYNCDDGFSLVKVISTENPSAIPYDLVYLKVCEWFLSLSSCISCLPFGVAIRWIHNAVPLQNGRKIFPLWTRLIWKSAHFKDMNYLFTSVEQKPWHFRSCSLPTISYTCQCYVTLSRTWMWWSGRDLILGWVRLTVRLWSSPPSTWKTALKSLVVSR